MQQQNFFRVRDDRLKINKRMLRKIDGRVVSAHPRFQINRDRIVEIGLLVPMSLHARNGDSIGLSQIW